MNQGQELPTSCDIAPHYTPPTKVNSKQMRARKEKVAARISGRTTGAFIIELAYQTTKKQAREYHRCFYQFLNAALKCSTGAVTALSATLNGRITFELPSQRCFRRTIHSFTVAISTRCHGPRAIQFHMSCTTSVETAPVASMIMVMQMMLMMLRRMLMKNHQSLWNRHCNYQRPLLAGTLIIRRPIFLLRRHHQSI
jgi:hypothetical protein